MGERVTAGQAIGGASPTGRRARRALVATAAFGRLESALRLAGAAPTEWLRALWHTLGAPLLAVLLFVAAWSELAPRVETSLGALPGPAAVWREAKSLVAEHRSERDRRAAFHEQQQERNARLRAMDASAEMRLPRYTGRPTYFDRIATSLKTVFTGFALAALVAVPLGILAGLSRTINAALSPLVQVFRTLSPLAWLPLVTLVVSALQVSPEPLRARSFVISAITVTLCSLWPALVNTALGVASIDKDLMNVARVLRLGWSARVRKIVLPSALPLIFTGLRLSLGVGWMVLIAAEVQTQHPGLGKFLWDEFQTGSSSSLARMLVAVLTIGVIGFLLDRVMLALQGAFTHRPARSGGGAWRSWS